MSTSNSPAAILWFRQDLRLADNPALEAAMAHGGPIIPVYIWSPDEEGDWPPGGASKWWLHHSLSSLDKDLRSKGSRLTILVGSTSDALEKLIRETAATAVFWNRRWEPAAREQESRVSSALSVQTGSFNSATLFEPSEIKTLAGGPFTVFTPFYKCCLATGFRPQGSQPPKALAAPISWPKSLELSELELLPKIHWDAGLAETWTPGEEGAQERFHDFVFKGIKGYQSDRNRPDHEGVSRLSPHLHFGELSPRQIVEEVRGHGCGSPGESYIREVCWREFAYHLLHHFPDTPTKPLREEFAKFPWENNSAAFTKWKRGVTGFPLVDAGMRQLWQTGWMHNRVRMVVASFLIKDILISWQDGSKWFWDTLVDADLANNTLGWQWTAGCGADAAPYFRVFNPNMQGAKFDPDGDYAHRYVSELAEITAETFYGKAPMTEDLFSEQISRYPEPIVDHDEARKRALAAFEMVKKLKT